MVARKINKHLGRYLYILAFSFFQLSSVPVISYPVRLEVLELGVEILGDDDLYVQVHQNPHHTWLICFSLRLREASTSRVWWPTWPGGAGAARTWCGGIAEDRGSPTGTDKKAINGAKDLHLWVLEDTWDPWDAFEMLVHCLWANIVLTGMCCIDKEK